MRLLLDEMYSPSLAERLRDAGHDVTSIVESGRAGSPDADVFALSIADDRALLTENVSDFVQLAAAQTSSGLSHPGVLIALSSRFSRRPSGAVALSAAIAALRDTDIADRVVFLEAIGRAAD
ncbi:DUF5615 family PIN-like protein [Tsukamurella pseudospumae]|uniref:DUF5615 domain-containing protein n=1 Tax=Tsukamurella pseudospumae TaxID=239498 RepID=A0A137ZM06_9ACTN|nr:DUF5615 family PIN-like protein [Tsukamurella pseudospumae]KXO99203.1 hypothetical protein AXK61_18210 [Tsukamurella pseudospumae]